MYFRPMVNAREMLQKYLEAEQSILDGKDIVFEGRRLSMPDLSQIQEGRKHWETKVAQEEDQQKNVKRIGGVSFSVARFDQ